MCGHTLHDSLTFPLSSHTGSSVGQPFIRETGSDFFRIPAMLTLQNGWILAMSDIRWRTTADSPANLDTIASISRDGGLSWDWSIVNYYDDMADTANGFDSASFIDPALLQAEDGTIHMLVDACAAYVGLMAGNKMGRKSTGFDEHDRLLVAKVHAGDDAPTEPADYNYYVDLNGAGFPVPSNEKKIYPICKSSDNSHSGIWVDAWLNLYYGDTQSSIHAVLCPQLHSDKSVHCNLFYRNSPWKTYPVVQTIHRTATVTKDGLSWSDPQFLNIKLTESENFTGVCPGRGISFRYNGKERLLFPLYDNDNGLELASTVYSDDGGKTWVRGCRHSIENLNGVGKTSESQVVILPNGNLRMYSRNLADYVSYADSCDGGVTWGKCRIDKALYSKSRGGGCMVSFINLGGTLLAPNGQVYSNLLLASYARIQRSEGIIRIGSVDTQGNVTWLNEDISRYIPAAFAYSCVTQLRHAGQPTGKFAILYEFGERTPKSSTLVYSCLSFEDLLGSGWSFIPNDSSI